MRILPVVVNLVLLIIVVVAIVLTPEVGDVGGADHERFQTMSRGGDGAERHDNVFWLGAAFGALTLSFCAALMALDGQRRGLGLAVLGTLVLNVAVWLWLLASYSSYLSGDEVSFVLALPGPTAILVYVLYPVSFGFNLLYVVGYKRWVLSDDDLEAYQRLVEERARRWSR